MNDVKLSQLLLLSFERKEKPTSTEREFIKFFSLYIDNEDYRKSIWEGAVESRIEEAVNRGFQFNLRKNDDQWQAIFEGNDQKVIGVGENQREAVIDAFSNLPSGEEPRPN